MGAVVFGWIRRHDEHSGIRAAADRLRGIVSARDLGIIAIVGYAAVLSHPIAPMRCVSSASRHLLDPGEERGILPHVLLEPDHAAACGGILFLQTTCSPAEIGFVNLVRSRLSRAVSSPCRRSPEHWGSIEKRNRRGVILCHPSNGMLQASGAKNDLLLSLWACHCGVSRDPLGAKAFARRCRVLQPGRGTRFGTKGTGLLFLRRWWLRRCSRAGCWRSVPRRDWDHGGRGNRGSSSQAEASLGIANQNSRQTTAGIATASTAHPRCRLEEKRRQRAANSRREMKGCHFEIRKQNNKKPPKRPKRIRKSSAARERERGSRITGASRLFLHRLLI